MSEPVGRFTAAGMLRIPTEVEEVPVGPEYGACIPAGQAYCPNGHTLADPAHPFEGHPGIKLGFRRPNGQTGVFVISPCLGRLDKVALSGEIVNGEKVSLHCPLCQAAFPVLALCDRCHDGDMTLIYGSQDLDVYKSFSVCNLFGCPNAMLIRADRVIRAVNKEAL